MIDSLKENYTGKQLFLLVLIISMVYGVSVGIRMNYGIILKAFNEGAHIPYDIISFVMAVGELTYGLTAPLFGLLAMKKSNAFVLKLGLILLGSGIILTGIFRNPYLLVISIGLILSGGTGALSFGLVMGAVAPYIGESKAATISGIINSSSGIGSSFMSVFLASLFSHFSILESMLILSVPVVLLFPTIQWLFKFLKKKKAEDTSEDIENLNEQSKEKKAKLSVRIPIKDFNYLALIIGFGTCGFHMSIFQNHLYSQAMSYGLSYAEAAVAYTAFGITIMIGAFIAGVLCDHYKIKNVLGSVYALRVVTVAVFMFLMPKTLWAVIVFAIFFGLTGDSTITPTSEIVRREYGVERLGFLYGMTFVGHQIGAFISTWLTGILYTMYGNYVLIWSIDIVLCAIAATASYCIRANKKTTL